MFISADQTTRFIKGPHENRWRLSIDMLFRSAAVVFNSRIIGIILMGLLDDGTAGRWPLDDGTAGRWPLNDAAAFALCKSPRKPSLQIYRSMF